MVHQQRNKFSVTIICAPLCWRLLLNMGRQTPLVSSKHSWKYLKPKTNIYLRSFNPEACRTNVQLTEQSAEETRTSYLWFWHCKTSIICTSSWNQNFTLRSLFRLEPPPSQRSKRWSWPDWGQESIQPTEPQGRIPNCRLLGTDRMDPVRCPIQASMVK